MKVIHFSQTDIGRIGIVEYQGGITNLYFETDQIPDDVIPGETELLSRADNQLTGYLTGKRNKFTLPLAPEGTPFMLTVWDELRNVPYGETRSYRQIAENIGNPGAFRAVGLANNRNPIPLFIPCHRIIGSDGNLTGYRGGLPIKSFLLELEKKHAVL